jgi:hypothetical protein
MLFFVSMFFSGKRKKEGKNDKDQNASVKHLSLTAPP